MKITYKDGIQNKPQLKDFKIGDGVIIFGELYIVTMDIHGCKKILSTTGFVTQLKDLEYHLNQYKCEKVDLELIVTRKIN